jgi:hypothetical protein
MTVKVLDTCCFLSLFKEITSCDMASVCRGYDMPITDHVISELSKPESAQISPKFRHFILSNVDKDSLYKEVRNAIQNLGPGEVSAFTLAVYLNETSTKPVVFITDDGKAIKKLSRFRSQVDIVKRYPHIQNLLIVRPSDMIEHLFRRGRIDRTALTGILSDLHPEKISGMERLNKI